MMERKQITMSILKKRKPEILTATVDPPLTGVSPVNVEFIPHFIYSNSENKIIGSIDLTEDQVRTLNQIMRYKGTDLQDISFLRK